MDLGCLDMGCIEKQITQKINLDSEKSPRNESSRSTSKSGKNKSSKEAGQSNTTGALNKVASQIKKPPHRKTSPLNWFPRKKMDSYLNRKIKLLQEVDGMNLTLDETLGNSNPHYSKVLREKIALREAADRAVEAQKAALVEASWCRILKAARIDSKEAEALLLKAEKNAAEAFDAATAIGVIMYDIPNCLVKHYEIETSSVNGGESTAHTVTTSFETAFEVDKQVAAAVKAALTRLAANCASINKDDFKEVLRKISQNPDSDQNDLSILSSECESDLEAKAHKNGETRFVEANKRNLQRKPAVEKFNRTKLVDMMLQRLQRLHEDELASLATIVATCGLNAALDEAEICSSVSYLNNVPKSISSLGERITKKQAEPEIPSLDRFLVKHLTRLEREVQAAKNANRQNNEPGEERGDEKLDNTDDVNPCTSKTKVLPEAAGLANILVKHSSKFEKEIEDAKKKSGEMFETEEKKMKTKAVSSFETVPDLGSTLTKHTSKLEKEIEEAKRTCAKMYEPKANKLGRASKLAVTKMKQENMEVPSLDKFLVKHVSRLEKEVLEAKMKRNTNLVESGSEELDLVQKSAVTSSTTKSSDKNSVSSNLLGKENVGINKKDEGKEMSPTTEATSFVEENKDTRLTEDGLDKVLVKKVHGLEKEKMKSLSSESEFRILQRKDRYGGNAMTNSEGLDKVLIKHVSRLEKEKMALGMEEEVMKVKRRNRNLELDQSEGRLDQIVVKHISSLEREKVSAAEQLDNNPTKHPLVAQREARERELQESWGGMSFGNVMRPHVSRLQREKAAWLKAEKDGRR